MEFCVAPRSRCACLLCCRAGVCGEADQARQADAGVWAGAPGVLHDQQAGGPQGPQQALPQLQLQRRDGLGRPLAPPRHPGQPLPLWHPITVHKMPQKAAALRQPCSCGLFEAPRVQRWVVQPRPLFCDVSIVSLKQHGA